jgi:hypothetical protein
MKQLLFKDEELKRSPEVHFRLEGRAFPDNKIFGTIDIEPEWAGDLIEEFTASIFINQILILI